MTDQLLANEQAALRRVATLVAEGATAAELFAAVATEVKHVLDVRTVMISRYEPGRRMTVLASVNEPSFTVGGGWPLDEGPSVAASVLDTSRPARIDDYTHLPGPIAAAVRESAVGSIVGAPIVVDGQLCGVITVGSREGELLPEDTDERLSAFTELLATAISNAESRDRLHRLADQQAALRRVAMLVAEGATAVDLGTAVVKEVSHVLEVPAVWLIRFEPERTASVAASVGDEAFPVGSRWQLDGASVTAAVFETGRPARIDDFAQLAGPIAGRTREAGFNSAVAVPITAEGTVWGAICIAATGGDPLPEDAIVRLSDFTELVATAISNADSRDRVQQLADEQAAVRRVATLVAEGATSFELGARLLEEVGRVLAIPAAWLVRYEDRHSITIVASLNDPFFPPGSSWPLDGTSVSGAVLETGRPQRIDDYTDLEGTLAARTRESEVRAVAGVPVVVDGSVWGCLAVGVRGRELLPARIETRLRDFTELVATAISNAASRERVQRLADEQAAPRRVATLVAEGAAPRRLFAAVAQDVARVLEVSSVSVVEFEPDGSSVVVASVDDPAFPVGSRWPAGGSSLNAFVFESGRAARIDHADASGPIAEAARNSGMRSGVGVPIVLDGVVWGMVAIGNRDRAGALPDDTEERLLAFTNLVSTAMSKAVAQDDLRRLASEQSALRRVATLVANAASPEDVFAAVAEEVGGLLGLKVEMNRYNSDGTATVIGAAGDHPFTVGSRWPLDGPSIMQKVFRSGRPERIDDFTELGGTVAEVARRAGFRAAIGAPIVVGGATWGVIIAISTVDEPIPASAEVRLAEFTHLVATAVSNLQANDDLHALADQQSALRRVATLVARQAPPDDVFAAVAEEISRVFGLPAIEVVRYGPDAVGAVIGNYGGHLPVGSRWPLDGPSIMESVFRTGRPARMDDYSNVQGTIAEAARKGGVGSAIGVPIVVDGATWGAVIALVRTEQQIPEGSETHLGLFTELIATAVSNLQAHDDLRALASQQTALRRVATLVAEGATVEEIFSGVASEVAQVLGVSGALLDRYEPDGTTVTLAAASEASWTTREGAGSECSVPILIDGKPWGSISVFSRPGELLPSDTEARLNAFTELVATAVSNAAARAELIASRARIVAAGDEARRRIERNLHDGTQQRLIALGLDLQRIRGTLSDNEQLARAGLDQLEADLESVLSDVRELSRGLHPPLLSRAGLRPSLRALARRSPIPVDLEIDLPERPPEAFEIAVYYVVSEALTNAIKHSEASGISVTIALDHTGGPFGIDLGGRGPVVNLHVTIADDGVGGAQPSEGSGLMGLADRVDALGGRLELESPPGGGTRISVELPLRSPVGDAPYVEGRPV